MFYFYRAKVFFIVIRYFDENHISSNSTLSYSTAVSIIAMNKYITRNINTGRHNCNEIPELATMQEVARWPSGRELDFQSRGQGFKAKSTRLISGKIVKLAVALVFTAFIYSAYA